MVSSPANQDRCYLGVIRRSGWMSQANAWDVFLEHWWAFPRRLIVNMTQFPRPEGVLTWTALTEGRWSLVVTKETGSVAASLSPIEHAWSDNREYLIGALEDGWWLAVEVDGKLTTLASPFPSEEAAKERAEALEADHR